jgi:hypothetical protein
MYDETSSQRLLPVVHVFNVVSSIAVVSVCWQGKRFRKFSGQTGPKSVTKYILASFCQYKIEL